MPIFPLIAAPLLALAPAAPPPPAAPAAEAAPEVCLPDELTLKGDNIIKVHLNGEALRLEVSPEAFGPPVINPDVAARLLIAPASQRAWRFGPVVVEGSAAAAMLDYGAGAAPVQVSWSNRPASTKADGVIGVHHLPYKRVRFAFHPEAAGETIQTFALKRAGGDRNTRLGTEVTVGKKKLMMIFVPERAENLITAPTANFIATHQDGGFEPGTDGSARMDFDVARPTRMMRIATPIALGELLIDHFAVRIEDYGEPTRVGEIAKDDPRFDKSQIIVSRRKGRGKPDLLTRIGSAQIAHCSAITYDLAGNEIRLSCGAAPE